MRKLVIFLLFCIQLLNRVSAQSNHITETTTQRVRIYPLPRNNPLYRIYLYASRNLNVTYVTSFLKQNWFGAKLACRARNMTLASVESEKISNQIRQRLIEDGFYRPRNVFWISGTNLATSNNFSWSSTGNPFTYTNWSDQRQINKNRGKGRCVAMRSDTKWLALPCTSRNYFICEKIE